MPFIAIIIGAVILMLLDKAPPPPHRQGVIPDPWVSGRKVMSGGLHAAPLECRPVSTSAETRTWVLNCELYHNPNNNNPTRFDFDPKTPPFARAVLKFEPRLSLEIRLVRGTDEQMTITTAEAKGLLNHDYESSPHLLVLPFMKMATTDATNNEKTLSIVHVPTRIGSAASFTMSQLKVGNSITSSFLQYYKT